ncbi:Abi family protein [Paeniglutamicibacter psychrophenolicus]|uniref:Abortive infection bacteriophage resistance protein n=1 Tax=Paeniglutamicibacter psychrophenolicus TaxID=257454 RepID=A0ABS4W8V8_9MICC|nr:Abi family protein [Paeniglutamicibacter psychrophenolicus]MBP2372628.1 abortive infection bacteriophage resistance protein [Paeniglutamicibacter psychrophenolicus]
MAEYDKKFLDFGELIANMKKFGLATGTDEEALEFLRTHGYFRSGGYRYVFREMLPLTEQVSELRQFRSDSYMDGSNLKDVAKLLDYEVKLREVMLKGLLDFEVRLRGAMAHVLAKRDVFGHLSEASLNEAVCNQQANMSSQATKFELWVETCNKAIEQAKSEDYIHHHLMKYGPPIPVWALLEVLSFGNLPYLFDLLKRDDQLAVARLFGVKQAHPFSAWIRSLIDLRNLCAHGGRVFNRAMKRKVAFNQSAIEPLLLGHLSNQAADAQWLALHSNKLYPLAAVLAYMLRCHPGKAQWPLTFRTQSKKLPGFVLSPDAKPLLTLEHNMGFPPGWSDLPLWSA